MIELTIAKDGVHGFYHEAINSIDDEKAIIVLGGSEGNDNIPVNIGRLFAKKGFAALGVCYWNVPGLPDSLIKVPIDPFEKAITWLKQKGHRQIAIYGISKGAELALLCASFMPDISQVIAVSPSHCIWSGLKGKKGMLSKRFVEASEFTWHDKEFPYMKGILKYGPAIKNLIIEHQLNLAYMYSKPLKKFNEAAAIKVENIQGDILFIYAKNDLMWPSKESTQYMVKRLKEHNWPHHVDVISYEKASHIMVPLNPPSLKMFKVERKYPKECQRNREEAFDKTISWLLKG